MKLQAAVFISVFAAALCAEASFAGEAIGVVTELRGNVVRKSGQVSETVTTGMEVFEKDMIVTEPKGFVTMKLHGTTTVTLGPNTLFAVDPFLAEQGTDLEIVAGPLGFESEQEQSPENEAIRTVFGMIGVRG